jgi:hypothetical protein
MEDRPKIPKEEDPAAKAKRLAEKIRGRLKDQLAKKGGSDAFLRWVRSDEDRIK